MWWTGSAVLQVMACHMFSAKPLPEPMMTFNKLDPYEETSLKFQSKYRTFLSWKCIWKCCLWNDDHFVQNTDHNILFSLSQLSSNFEIFETEDSGMNVVLCTKFQNYWSTEMNVMEILWDVSVKMEFLYRNKLQASISLLPMNAWGYVELKCRVYLVLSWNRLTVASLGQRQSSWDSTIPLPGRPMDSAWY